jgi:OOP family OmpA-OmpF porin
MNGTLPKQFTRVALLAAATIMAGNLAASEPSPGYWYESTGEVWKNPYGECWRTIEWSEANAIMECDPDLFAQVVEEPPPPVYEKVTIGAEVLFAFDSAELKPTARERLDGLVQKIDTFPELNRVRITGHTDRIGSEEYNQGLSERRARSVEAYILTNSRKVRASQIEAIGLGERDPIVPCEGYRNRAALIECLQPNRRVEVEIIGEDYVEGQ